MSTLKDKLKAGRSDDSLAEKVDPSDVKLEALELERNNKTKKRSNKGVIKVHGNADSRVSPCTNKNVKIRDAYLQRINDMFPSIGKETLIINEAIRRGLDQIDSELVKGDVHILGD